MIITMPLAIIPIHLENMNHNLSIICYNHIEPWLQGNLVHVDFDFNFVNFDNDVVVHLNMMLDRFGHGDLKE